MLKTKLWGKQIVSNDYKPEVLRQEIFAFLNENVSNALWNKRLVTVASELVANACSHRFDIYELDFAIKLVFFHDKVNVQMSIDDTSNLLIMQRYRNLSLAVSARKSNKPYKKIHGRGLEIVMHWTDEMRFSKKRTGGLRVVVNKTVPLLAHSLPSYD